MCTNKAARKSRLCLLACNKPLFSFPFSLFYSITMLKWRSSCQTRFRKCTPHDLLHKGLHAIFNILPPNAKESITQFIMDDLQEIARCVLIVFEGDKATLDSNVETNHNRHPSLLKVKMIDFAHVFQTRASDDNYLEGLNSLISYFQSLSHIFRSTSPVTDKAS
ncbi:hypothetical protein EB796_016486 [Bugula neritina]|uniref:Uncharacterized protein n=1 Tax=Bugula neritina TaxID=10212 RepID=A0A7J7JHX0_BUGNE|nr:hypothetical protein EB796_016486 [Bugula neritina]